MIYLSSFLFTLSLVLPEIFKIILQQKNLIPLSCNPFNFETNINISLCFEEEKKFWHHGTQMNKYNFSKMKPKILKFLCNNS